MRKVLIPAAGFGKRVGSPPAKELLLDPETGRPLIEFAFRLAEEAQATPLVITRRDKTALLDALAEYPQTEIFLIDSSAEWTDTVRQSAPAWGKTNVLILPDTRFRPPDIAKQIFIALAGCDLAFACFEEPNLATWGAIEQRGNSWFIAEKPAAKTCSSAALAWGLFGFRRNSGAALMKSLVQSSADHSWQKLPASPEILKLESFRDLTR